MKIFLKIPEMLRKWLRKIPLTWQQLTKDKARLIVALAGIAFADILIFAQLGFESALFESSMGPHKSLNADLVLVNSHFETVYYVKSFPRQRLYQARGFAGVESVSPLYISLGQWKNPENSRTQRILVFGVDPSTKAFNFAEVNQNLHQLQMLNTVLFDRTSLPEFGSVASIFQQQGTVKTEINDVTIRVRGLFTLGVSFAAYGNIITSDSTFLNLFDGRRSHQIEVGLIKLNKNANIQEIAANLQAGLPKDVRVLTLEKFAATEKTYWATTTPIGFIFGLGVIVSFIVGIVIVYQILYSDVSAHLDEYVTLKAMGYSNRFLLAVLAQEAFFLAVFAYLPGFILSFGLYEIAASATMLPIYMTIQRGLIVLILTLVMSFISGAIAIRKLKSADPADLL